MRPFGQSFFFQWYAPFIKPWVQRAEQREYMQSWTLLFVVWLIAMAALPSLNFLVTFMLDALKESAIIQETLMESITILFHCMIGFLEVWSLYYIIRLSVTKLFYWHRGKYPDWPTQSIFYQMDRYIFRPEVIACALLTFLWVQLGHFLTGQDNLYTWFTYFQLWLSWVGGAVWPMVSIFFHREVLEL